MKNLFFIKSGITVSISLLMLSCFLLPVKAGKWVFQNNLPFRFNSVFFIDANNWWAVGNNGSVHQTMDGGYNWTQKDLNTTADLRDIFFINQDHGWIVGGIKQGPLLENLDRIFCTKDGGNTWESYKNQKWEPILEKVWFIDAAIGWAAGQGFLLMTRNGGKTWKVVPKSPIGQLYDMIFTNSTTGYMLLHRPAAYGTQSFGVVMHTSDSGRNWKRQDIDALVKKIHFYDKDCGWTISNDSFFKTNDSGNTWIQIDAFSISSKLNTIYFIDQITGWVGGSGFIAKTHDGGDSWSLEDIYDTDNNPIRATLRVNYLYFSNNKEGWAIIGSSIYKYDPDK